MRPEKRATCKEVVEKFREIYERASADEDYCLQPVHGHPKRVKTDLSTLSPHVFDTTRCGASNSQCSHRGIRGSQSKSPSISRPAEQMMEMNEQTRLSMSRVEEASPLEMPKRLQELGEKRQLGHSPSTNRSSSRSTKKTSSRLQSPPENGECAVTRRGLRQRLRFLLCW